MTYIDFHEWCVQGQSRPVSVVATAATGVYFETHACCAVELVELLVQMQTPESEPITLTYFLQVWPSLVALTQRTPSVSLCSG